MPGPAPTPTEFLRARGSWRADTRDGEVRFEQKEPTCPKCLKGEARREWRRIVKQLLAAGILQMPDRALLSAWCEAWADFCKCVEDLAVTGSLISTPNGVAKNPLISVKNAAVERMVKLAGQFGFSPAARSRIKSSESKTDEPAGKSRFFGDN